MIPMNINCSHLKLETGCGPECSKLISREKERKVIVSGPRKEINLYYFIFKMPISLGSR